jgi:hypothetical protein
MIEQHPRAPSRPASVVLDIGGEIGALILHTTPGLAGAEIEISPARDPASRSHAAVRERRGNGQSRYAAIYPALPAGDYTLWTADGREAMQVTITGATVTEAVWPVPHA